MVFETSKGILEKKDDLNKWDEEKNHYTKKMLMNAGRLSTVLVELFSLSKCTYVKLECSKQKPLNWKTKDSF